jgi:hypothetical protein
LTLQGRSPYVLMEIIMQEMTMEEIDAVNGAGPGGAVGLAVAGAWAGAVAGAAFGSIVPGAGTWRGCVWFPVWRGDRGG